MEGWKGDNGALVIFYKLGGTNAVSFDPLILLLSCCLCSMEKQTEIPGDLPKVKKLGKLSKGNLNSVLSDSNTASTYQHPTFTL